ncbi:MAG: Uncharacterised protein [Acidimicrobiaceae bacterium]|nr:MAG: Uncharacterised protein [Acidimicrobiaceae bacterium]
MSEEENNEDENPADFEEEEFPEDIEEEEDLEDAPLDDDDDDDDDESAPTPVADSNEDDDDEDPADVEADLDAILKDRIASGEDEEEEDASTATKKEAPVQGEEDSVEARRKGEVICPSCFLIIEAQIAKETGECPHCGASV